MLPIHQRSPLILGLAICLPLTVVMGCSRTSGGAGSPSQVAPMEIPVKVVRPKRDSSLVVSIQQPAYVQGFYQADILARAAGPVKYLVKDIGNLVKQGELLMEIDVPDRVQDVALKNAVIEQMTADLTVSEENVKAAEAQVHTDENNVDVMKASVIDAEATKNYRESEYYRYKVLAERKAITPDVVDEQYKNYRAAVAGLASARAGVKRSISTYEGSKAKLEAARADVILKQTNITVARKNRDYAQAQLGLATIFAPFDGMIVKRGIDPGSFVKDATNSGGLPLMTLVRTDIVTVAMKVPDNYSTFVSPRTIATITMDELPGKLIQARISRYASYIEGKDRTMRVEVDMYNGPRKEYDRFLAKGLSTYLASYGVPSTLASATLLSAGQTLWSPNLKGRSELVPLYPRVSDQRPLQDRYLLPGMYGAMRLNLQDFEESYLLPAGSVFSRGGKLFIAQVKDGKARMLPVRVKVDDGTVVKLWIITKEANPLTGEPEIHRDLSENDEIIKGDQGELSEGQAVKPTLVPW